jgi:hypothetical protein
MRSMLAILGLSAALLLPAMPLGAAATDRYEVEMEMRFLGMNVGRVNLTSDVNAQAIDSRMDIATAGLVRSLTGFKSEITGAGRLAGNGDVWPERFASFYETKRETREVDVRYDEAGRVVGLATFKRGEPTRVEVPEAMQHGTIDPLSALFTIRNWLAEVRDLGSGQRTLELFDGRRRYDLEVRYLARRPATFGGGRPVLELRLDLKPIAGFNEPVNQNRRSARELFVLVSDDDLLMPLIIRTAAVDGVDAMLRTRRICYDNGTRNCHDVRY